MRKRVSAAITLAIAAGLSAPFFTAGTAHAIPAFARQNKTECSTCHTIFPELNEHGENFYRNSFVMEGKDKVKKDTGGEKAYLAIASLPEYVPLSVTGTLTATYDEDAAKDNKLDFATRALVLQAGGSLRDKVGFYANYTLYSEGPFDPNLNNVPGNNTPNLNELWVSARHIFDTPVNFKIGRMRPDLSLWKGFNKTSITPFATTGGGFTGSKVGDSQFFIDAPIDAVEANAVLLNRLYVVGGAAKRKQQDKVEGYGSIAYKIGGVDFEGHEQDVNWEKESILDFLSVTLNGFGYAGSTKQGPAGDLRVDDFYRYGVEADVKYKRFHAKLGTLFGQDDNPFFVTTVPTKIKTKVFAGDVEYLIGSQVIPSFRYEYEDMGSITRRYITAIAYAPLQNVKIVAEYKRADEPTRSINLYSMAGVVAF